MRTLSILEIAIKIWIFLPLPLYQLIFKFQHFGNALGSNMIDASCKVEYLALIKSGLGLVDWDASRCFLVLNLFWFKLNIQTFANYLR